MSATALPPAVVLGAGAWGTALALVLAYRAERVYLWGRDAEAQRRIAADRVNARYLPDVRLPSHIEILEDLALLPAEVRTAVLVTPFQSTREVLSRLRAAAPQVARIACAAKGLEAGTHLTAPQIVAEVCGAGFPVAVLSGPNFALEVAQGLPAAITVAADTAGFGAELLERLYSPRFRPYLSADLTGVAIGGGVKNVLAIAAGISDGLGLGANCRAALITRGLAEITRLGTALGGRPETFMGLSGLGDVVLTCTDDLSRNRRFGLAIGGGQSLAAAREEIGLVEGLVTAGEVVALAARLGIEMPIATQVAATLRGDVTPAEAVAALMSREPGVEARHPH
ncbi:MAG: NAD(P)-dependent glycerol-3-phosphate dehydrogenase [Gammaproteobacteria bacterium]|nr:NAD(P)-dependent glycerol-3-phosphate dehydrogenase [Gammaproteobacteria bacterium]